MSFWRRLLWRFTRPADQDLDRELRAHLELEAEEQQESGLPPDEARYAARRAFGNVTLIKEDARAMWGWGWFERLMQDLKHSFRLASKNPGFTAAATLTLALGIGANTAIFSAVHGMLMHPLPVEELDRIFCPSVGRARPEPQAVPAEPGIGLPPERAARPV